MVVGELDGDIASISIPVGYESDRHPLALTLLAPISAGSLERYLPALQKAGKILANMISPSRRSLRRHVELPEPGQA